MSDNAKPVETAATVYERIRRRRELERGASGPLTDRGDSAAAGSAAALATAVETGALRAGPDGRVAGSGATGTPTEAAIPGPIRIDEVLQRSENPSAPPSPPGDHFPRSATMRFALEHPAVALAIGVPTALLIARSPSSRRLLASVARIGASPLIWRLAQISASAVAIDRRLVDKTRD